MKAARKRRKANATGEPGAHTIRVVAEQTGFQMGTLRAWERRYGFPRPERREGSNRRLYSDADIQKLVAIARTLERGYRIGDVIEKSVAELERLARPAADPPSAPSVGALTPAAIDELIDLLANDRLSELEAELRRGAVLLGPRRFVMELAQPFAVSVGQAWADGRLSIRHEHLATECLVTQIRLMLANYQDLDGRPRVVLATLPGEAHTLPLQLIALYLVTAGAKPRLLGGATPVREIAECARMLAADAVGIAVTIDQDHAQLARDLKTLRRGLGGGVPIWLGGAGARSHEQPGALVLTTWEEIDRAVVGSRGSPKASRTSVNGEPGD